jgi:hypothetical protein
MAGFGAPITGRVWAPYDIDTVPMGTSQQRLKEPEWRWWPLKRLGAVNEAVKSICDPTDRDA